MRVQVFYFGILLYIQISVLRIFDVVGSYFFEWETLRNPPECQKKIVINKANGKTYVSPDAIGYGNKIMLCAMISDTPPVVHKGNAYVNLDWAILYFKKIQDVEMTEMLTMLKTKIAQRVEIVHEVDSL